MQIYFQFISNRKLFHPFVFCISQTPRRKLQFQDRFPGVPLPPQPIHTRWGTWIEAALYYATHFQKIQDFLNECDGEEAQSIENAKEAIVKPYLKRDLAFIKCNFECLTVTITKIQSKGVLLSETIEIFDSVRPILAFTTKRKEFLKKFDYVANKNTGLATLRKISMILSGHKFNEPDKFIDELTPHELQTFKYAPVVSCDVERSFSDYKRVLDNSRRSFIFENLRKHLVIYCNKFT